MPEKKVMLNVRVSEKLRAKYKAALAARKETMQMHLVREIINYVTQKD